MKPKTFILSLLSFLLLLTNCNKEKVTNVTVPDGISTMSDFIVEYPDN